MTCSELGPESIDGHILIRAQEKGADRVSECTTPEYLPEGLVITTSCPDA